jgi:hypothetical protein
MHCAKRLVCLRLQSRHEDYNRVNREPNIGSIFLIRFILQSLADGK